jgi:hypothetical protein
LRLAVLGRTGRLATVARIRAVAGRGYGVMMPSSIGSGRLSALGQGRTGDGAIRPPDVGRPIIGHPNPPVLLHHDCLTATYASQGPTAPGWSRSPRGRSLAVSPGRSSRNLGDPQCSDPCIRTLRRSSRALVGSLLLSCGQASVTEFTHRTPARDEAQACGVADGSPLASRGGSGRAATATRTPPVRGGRCTAGRRRSRPRVDRACDHARGPRSTGPPPRFCAARTGEGRRRQSVGPAVAAAGVVAGRRDQERTGAPTGRG